MGFVIVVALGLYLLISMGVVAGAISYAKKHAKSAKRWGWGAALGMYLFVFWDWIPTVVAHKYYCATEAGFWVYKTPEQWKTENPRVTDELKSHQSVQTTDDGEIQTINERFAIKTHRDKPIPLLSTTVANRQLVDTKTGELMAKTIEIGSGVGNIATGGGVKFWLNQKPCIAKDFWKFTSEIE